MAVMKAMKKAMKKGASIVYDSVVPAGYKPGLHVTIVRAGHRYCECMRGTKLRFFRKHDPAFGEWTMGSGCATSKLSRRQDLPRLAYFHYFHYFH